MIATGLARLQDPQPEGLATRGLKAVKGTNALGLLPILTLTNALGLLFVSFSYYSSQYDLEFFFFAYFSFLCLMWCGSCLRQPHGLSVYAFSVLLEHVSTSFSLW